MNKLSKKSKYIVAAAIALATATAGVGIIHAQSNSSQSTNPVSSLVNAIASKFNLNPADVQAVFDSQKAQMQALRQQNFTDRINQAVSSGKLTQAQADLIIAKQKEVSAFVDSLKGQSQAQRQASMKTEMNSLKQWASANNIPLNYLRFAGAGHHFGRGR